jgi:F0F1-type ATP synthase assembly protein I
MQGLFDDKEEKTDQAAWPDDNSPRREEPVILSNYSPPSPDETVRRSGLAWSAGISFFGAIVFMLFLGWLADWLLGSSPWGLVGGIVLGSIIGFLQFFRITSQIFNGERSVPSEHPLMPQPSKSNEERRDRFD